jgi:hypothetical protein
MRSVPASYAEDWTPRIGSDAVASYLAFKSTQRVGGLLGAVSWPMLFVGLGLAFIPIIVVGVLLLIINLWVLFVRARGQRALAVYYAREHIGVPPDKSSPPISGSPEVFDVWESSRGYGGKTWQPHFGRQDS